MNLPDWAPEVPRPSQAEQPLVLLHGSIPPLWRRSIDIALDRQRLVHLAVSDSDDPLLEGGRSPRVVILYCEPNRAPYEVWAWFDHVLRIPGVA